MGQHWRSSLKGASQSCAGSSGAEVKLCVVQAQGYDSAAHLLIIGSFDDTITQLERAVLMKAPCTLVLNDTALMP